ncbi:hypothetical protein SBA2_50016 [Acidobacteriia bacterium SbA2]|nr:hypothetical protein SBA2_50016 [Acidobacteriia bacterium SbA2]
MRPRTTHGLSNGLFRFFGGNRSAVSIYLRKITPKRIYDFLSPLVGEDRGLECTYTHGLAFKYLAADQALDGSLLVGGEILCLVYHRFRLTALRSP